MKMTKSRLPFLLLILVGLGMMVLAENVSWTSEKPPLPTEVVGSAERIAKSPVPEANEQPMQPDAAEAKVATPSDDRRSAIIALNPLAALQRQQLDDTVERPLFIASRRAYKPPPPAPPRPVAARPPPSITKPTYLLVGVMVGRKSRMALLRPRDGNSDIQVKPGDMLGQWQVKSVEKDSITLAQGESAFTLEVFPK